MERKPREVRQTPEVSSQAETAGELQDVSKSMGPQDTERKIKMWREWVLVSVSGPIITTGRFWATIMSAHQVALAVTRAKGHTHNAWPYGEYMRHLISNWKDEFVAGFNAETQRVEWTGDRSAAKVFETPSQAYAFVGKYSNAGYGMRNDKTRLVPLEDDTATA